ncbi:hypothetical protein NHH73_21480 [Oxalobacteraceae bacterium OTU3CINTB1]|nr:hypothetical protein NHH73_21480 [Oxalobacteraceae bacterium OTU3CINTB1]
MLAILFRLMRSRTDAQMREALGVFAQRLQSPDMSRARDSLMRWVRAVLQDEFCETEISMEEGPIMLFDQRFKKYEDLLEYEAIERGRARGKEEGRQEGRQEGALLALQGVVQSLVSDSQGRLSVDLSERILAADEDELRRWIKSLACGAKAWQLFAGP